MGASAGGAAFAGLGHYIVLISVIGILVTLWAYPIAALWGGAGFGKFGKAMIAPQSVAISTRSSLASLPAMLAAARVIGVREQVADVTLPLSVALFRATGPAMNTAVAFYVAHWLGYEPTMTQIIAATAVGAVMSYGAISLPGEVSFISSIAPIAMALGVPIAPLALAGGGGDGSGHFPHARQRHARRRGHHRGRPKRGSGFGRQRDLTFVESPPDERTSSTAAGDRRA